MFSGEKNSVSRQVHRTFVSVQLLSYAFKYQLLLEKIMASNNRLIVKHTTESIYYYGEWEQGVYLVNKYCRFCSENNPLWLYATPALEKSVTNKFNWLLNVARDKLEQKMHLGLRTKLTNIHTEL